MELADLQAKQEKRVREIEARKAAKQGVPFKKQILDLD